MQPESLWHTPNKDDPDDKARRATQLVGEAAAIEGRQASWHQLNLWHSTLVFNRELPAFRWGEPVAEWELQPVDLKTENLMEAIGEAYLSKASSSPLKPTLVPHGRRLDTEHAVRTLDNFLFGCWMQTESEEAAIQMFLDGYVSGKGCVEVAYNRKTTQLHVESVFFDNLIIDNRECPAGPASTPRTYRIRRILPRALVEARYDVQLDKTTTYPVEYRSGVADGWTVVIEAWRLPDDNGQGGYHMGASGNTILFEEKWTETWVPLIFFDWADHRSGFFGKSGVEQLLPFQIKQNDLNEAIDKAIDLICVPRLILNANSMVDVNQWDNEFGRMLLYSGMEPKPFEWRCNIVDLLNERVRNRANAFNHMGLSEQFTEANLPDQVRLDSSAGIREFHNMEDRRNLRRWTRFEKARMNIAKTILRVLGTEKGAEAYTAFFHAGGRVPVKSIPFSEVQQLVKEDEFGWTMAATPLAAMSPAARRELIRDFTSRGLVKEGSDEARRMEGNTNLERVEELEMSSKEDIDLRVLKNLEKGIYEPPDITTNTTYGIPAVLANINKLRNYEDVGPTDPRISLHKRWVTAAISLQKQVVAMTQQPTGPQMTPFSPTQGVAGTNSSQGAAPPAAA